VNFDEHLPTLTAPGELTPAPEPAAGRPADAIEPVAPPIPARSRPAGFSALARMVLHPLGIDRPIAYILIGRGWSAVAGLLNIAAIARFMRPDEQGYYYTFSSITALYTLFELGLTFVLTQFVSHEKAHLEWTDAGTVSGSERAKLRLAAFSRRALQWYSTISALFLILVLPGGLYFFARNSAGSDHVNWRVAWIWFISATVFNFCIAPFFSILEGCGRISEMALARTVQIIIANSGVWIALSVGAGLFSAAVFPIASFLVGFVWLLGVYRGFFRDLFRTDVSDAPFHWWTEVWPFQWRMAVGSASNYLVFQLFVPVLFAAQGPIAAGQMGMSLSLCNSLLSGSMAWMTTKAAPFGVLVAKRQWMTLDGIFFRTFRQSILILLAGSLVLGSAVVLLKHFHFPVSKRFLGTAPFATLLLATIVSHAVFCEALYLRTHKAEPFLTVSVTGALIASVSTLLVAKPFGAMGVSLGYLVCCSVSLILGTSIFLRKRREWHA
jgi:hypothetical protein